MENDNSYENYDYGDTEPVTEDANEKVGSWLNSTDPEEQFSKSDAEAQGKDGQGSNDENSYYYSGEDTNNCYDNQVW